MKLFHWEFIDDDAFSSSQCHLRKLAKTRNGKTHQRKSSFVPHIQSLDKFEISPKFNSDISFISIFENAICYLHTYWHKINVSECSWVSTTTRNFAIRKHTYYVEKETTTSVSNEHMQIRCDELGWFTSANSTSSLRKSEWVKQISKFSLTFQLD